jgi:hypothetical protein
MLFGVYFVFAGINEIMTDHLEKIKEMVKQHSQNTAGANYVSTKNRLILNVIAIILVLFLAALTFMSLEGWTFITSLYFAIETSTVT